MKLNFDFIFDGVSDGKGLKSQFNEAIKLVSKGNYRSSPKDRSAMLNLQLLSDFLSGGARGKQFAPALAGFYGEPKNLAAYSSPDSAPDVELTYEALVTMFGEKIASQFAFDPSVTDAGSRTIEIKQSLSGGTTTFTQLGGQDSAQNAASIERIRREATIKEKVDSKGKVSIKASLYDQDKLFRWFEAKEQTAYRNALLTQFEQKMQNYLLFSYVDGKFKALAAPGLAKAFNVRSSAARRRKLLTLEYTGGASGGSVALRTSAAGSALIKQLNIDVTNQIVQSAEKHFLQNILDFYVRGEGSKVLRKTGLNTKYGFVNAFAELLLIAREFEKLPASLSFQTADQKMGKISSRANPREQADKPVSAKQQLISEVQLTALVQKAMLQRMPQGSPGGPPAPTPGILTNRTGTFVRSTQITLINKRNKEIKFKYDPIYKIHESTYKPTELISQSIREVAQQAFGKRFYVYREGF